MVQFIKDLRNNDPVESTFSVKYKHPPKKYVKGLMFGIGLTDRTGEIEATFWGKAGEEESVRKTYDSFQVNDIVVVSGKIGEFRNKLKINIDPEDGGIRKAKPSEYSIEDFIPRTNQDVEKIVENIKAIIQSFENPHLKRLLELFFEDENFMRSFKRVPAAMYMHHACIGGLLEHIWEVVQICQTAAAIHTSLNKDLLLAGAILHDCGKIEEFNVTTNIKVSEVGMLRGHISLGEEMVIEKIRSIKDFPSELKMKLLHIVLSHHGKKENGALKEPQFPEAATIYYADELSSKVTQYIRLKKDVDTEDFRTYSKTLGEIYLR